MKPSSVWGRKKTKKLNYKCYLWRFVVSGGDWQFPTTPTTTAATATRNEREIKVREIENQPPLTLARFYNLAPGPFGSLCDHSVGNAAFLASRVGYVIKKATLDTNVFFFKPLTSRRPFL